MIIAGPAAAVGIMILLCATYYWHTVQAKRLSITLFVTPDEKTTDGKAPAPSRSQRLVPSKSKTSLDADFGVAYKHPVGAFSDASHSLYGKKGSSWSALADQEIVDC